MAGRARANLRADVRAGGRRGAAGAGAADAGGAGAAAARADADATLHRLVVLGEQRAAAGVRRVARARAPAALRAAPRARAGDPLGQEGRAGGHCARPGPPLEVPLRGRRRGVCVCADDGERLGRHDEAWWPALCPSLAAGEWNAPRREPHAVLCCQTRVGEEEEE